MGAIAIFDLLKTLILIGAGIVVLNLLPIDATVKKIGTLVGLVILAIYIVKWLAGMA